MNPIGVAMVGAAPSPVGLVLRLGFWTALSACAVGFAAFALLFLHAPPVEPRVANAGIVDEYAVGTVRHFRPAGRDLITTTHYTEGVAVHGWPLYQSYACGRRAAGFFVLRREDGFVALADQSTDWRRSPVEYVPAGWRGSREPRLQDTCGEGTFTMDDGQVLAGRASRPLDMLPIRIVAGRLFVTVDPIARQPRGHEVRARGAL